MPRVSCTEVSSRARLEEIFYIQRLAHRIGEALVELVPDPVLGAVLAMLPKLLVCVPPRRSLVCVRRSPTYRHRPFSGDVPNLSVCPGAVFSTIGRPKKSVGGWRNGT